MLTIKWGLVSVPSPIPPDLSRLIAFKLILTVVCTQHEAQVLGHLTGQRILRWYVLVAGLSTAITSSSHCLQVVALSLISPFPPSAFYLKILSWGAVDGGSMVSVAMDWILWNTMLARPAMLCTMPPHYYYLSTSIGSHRHYAFKSSRGWCPRVLE